MTTTMCNAHYSALSSLMRARTSVREDAYGTWYSCLLVSLRYGNTINSLLVIRDKPLLMHSDPARPRRGDTIIIFCYLRLHLARSYNACSVCPVIIPEPSYDTDAETE